TLHHLTSNIMLGPFRRLQILQRPPLLFSNSPGVCFYPGIQFLSKLSEVFVQNSLTSEKLVHTLTIAERAQAAAKKDSIKTRKRPFDTVLMALQKSLHGCPPSGDVLQTHHAGFSHGASSFWLRPERLRCVHLCSSVDRFPSVISLPA